MPIIKKKFRKISDTDPEISYKKVPLQRNGSESKKYAYKLGEFSPWFFQKIKVPFNGKARDYRPESHMYLISLNFRGFLILWSMAVF